MSTSSDNTQIFSYVQRMSEAVLILRDKGFTQAALMLVYATIDQLAWLSVPDDESNGKQFKEWVRRYLLVDASSCIPDDVTPEDIWGARCGLLHTGTAESREFNQLRARHKLYYTFGGQEAISHEPDEIFVSLEGLMFATLKASLSFKEELENDQAQKAITYQKMNKLFIQKII